MPFAIQIYPDGSSEEVFYADPVPISAAQNENPQHDSVQVDGGVIHMDGDLDKPFVITKTLTQAQKYMTCKTDEDAEQFSVNGIGQVICQDVGCQEVEATESVSVGPSNDKILLASVDTDDVRIYKNLYMEPSGGVHPLVMTRGSIVTLQDGFFGFVPTEGQHQIPGHVYRLGRQENIGDLTHDNDGLNMRKTLANQDDANETLTHRVHICPDPTDPSILICSKKHSNQDGFNFEGDYIQCRNVGPNTPPTYANLVFQVDKDGDIQSQQIDNLVESTTNNYAEITGLLGQCETLDSQIRTNENNIRYDLIGIGDRILNNEDDIVDIKGNATTLGQTVAGIDTDVDGLFTSVGNIQSSVTALQTAVTDNDTDIAALVTSGGAHAADIQLLQTDVTALQNATAGGLEKHDVTTHDTKNIGSNGDYTPTNLSWGSASSPRTVDWGANPTSLTLYSRKSGAVYLPDPNIVNLERGNVVTMIYAPRIGHNSTFAVFVHDETEAYMGVFNQNTAKFNHYMNENRTAKFVYLGLNQSLAGTSDAWENKHRWLLEYID